jgi:hypothetical protein
MRGTSGCPYTQEMRTVAADTSNCERYMVVSSSPQYFVVL